MKGRIQSCDCSHVHLLTKALIVDHNVHQHTWLDFLAIILCFYLERIAMLSQFNVELSGEQGSEDSNISV